MKKFFTLFSLLIFLGMSANVMAQSTGINPEIGAPHTYTVTGNTGSSFVWTLTLEENGVGTNLLGDVANGSSTTNSIELTWVNPTPGSIYFLHVVETGDNGCTNRKAIAIQPVNNFQMDIANVDASGAPLDTDYSTCAPAVVVNKWNGADPVTADNANSFEYDYGSIDFYYKVTATGITNTDWLPVFTIEKSPASGAEVTAGYSTSIGGAYTSDLNTDGTNNTVTITDGNEFFVKVTVSNAKTWEGLTATDITLNLDEAASEDVNGNIVTSTNTDTTNQSMNQRPNTGNITTN